MAITCFTKAAANRKICYYKKNDYLCKRFARKSNALVAEW